MASDDRAVAQPGALALVTGGGRRIGEAIVRALHERGLDLLFTGRSSLAAGERLAAELNAVRPGSAGVRRLDLADDSQIAALAAEVNGRGRLDLLVHNASAFYPTPFGAVTPDAWDDLLASNLRGPFFLTQALRPALAAASGSIVALADIHGERPLRGHAVYSIAKAGLIMMVRSLARELGPEIRVNAVAPGYILSPPAGFTDSVENIMLQRIALGRRGAPEDIAGAVCYLGLDAGYVTGQVLAIDGGRSLFM